MGETVIEVRNHLDSWKLWAAIALVGGFVSVVVLAFTLARINDIRADQLREDAIRDAAALAAYRRCLEEIVVARRVNVYLRGVRELAAVLTENARETLAATPRSSPMRPARQRSFTRMVLAQDSILGLPRFPSPTRGECLEQYRRGRGGP